MRVIIFLYIAVQNLWHTVYLQCIHTTLKTMSLLVYTVDISNTKITSLSLHKLTCAGNKMWQHSKNNWTLGPPYITTCFKTCHPKGRYKSPHIQHCRCHCSLLRETLFTSYLTPHTSESLRLNWSPTRVAEHFWTLSGLIKWGSGLLALQNIV